jgi:hypothetical protein
MNLAAFQYTVQPHFVPTSAIVSTSVANSGENYSSGTTKKFGPSSNIFLEAIIIGFFKDSQCKIEEDN